jgi:hypothetical protein
VANPGYEELLTDLLTMIARVGLRLARRAGELNHLPEWSGVTHEFGAVEFNADEPDRELALWGYVDGGLAGLGGVVWLVEARRRGNGWEVSRAMHLGSDVDPEFAAKADVELPTLAISDSRQLSRALPDLVEELLAIPAPGT